MTFGTHQWLYAIVFHSARSVRSAIPVKAAYFRRKKTCGIDYEKSIKGTFLWKAIL